MSDADTIRLLAERVMGWRDSGGLFWMDGRVPLMDWLHHDWRDRSTELERRDFGHLPVWHPLESIADAWMVADKMVEMMPTAEDMGCGAEDMGRGFDSQPWFCLERDRDEPKWCAGWKGSYDYEGESWGWCAVAPTACRAICAAALLAIGEETP